MRVGFRNGFNGIDKDFPVASQEYLLHFLPSVISPVDEIFFLFINGQRNHILQNPGGNIILAVHRAFIR